jgi:ornithine decarboxylase
MSRGNNFSEIQVFDDALDNMDIVKSIINDRKTQEDGFYTVDIGDVIEKHREWISKMPRVAPHFGMSRALVFSALFVTF